MSNTCNDCTICNGNGIRYFYTHKAWGMGFIEAYCDCPAGDALRLSDLDAAYEARASDRPDTGDTDFHTTGGINTDLVIDYEDHDPAELQRAFCTIAREEALDLAAAEGDNLGDLEMFYYDLDDDWQFGLLAD